MFSVKSAFPAEGPGKRFELAAKCFQPAWVSAQIFVIKEQVAGTEGLNQLGDLSAQKGNRSLPIAPSSK